MTNNAVDFADYFALLNCEIPCPVNPYPKALRALAAVCNLGINTSTICNKDLTPLAGVNWVAKNGFPRTLVHLIFVCMCNDLAQLSLDVTSKFNI